MVRHQHLQVGLLAVTRFTMKETAVVRIIVHQMWPETDIIWGDFAHTFSKTPESTTLILPWQHCSNDYQHAYRMCRYRNGTMVPSTYPYS
jgi:hypothetical protein